MYDYYDELNKALNIIDKIIERVNSGVITVPVEELSGDETPVEHVRKVLNSFITR